MTRVCCNIFYINVWNFAILIDIVYEFWAHTHKNVSHLCLSITVDSKKLKNIYFIGFLSLMYFICLFIKRNFFLLKTFPFFFFLCLTDKNPLMNEFLAQIKSTPDLQTLFDSIQKDSSGSVTESTVLMDVS